MSLKKLPNVQNVVAGESFTIEIPVGPTYEQILLDIQGATGAQIQNIECQINGTTFQKFDDLDQLDALNDYWNRPYSGNYHTLFFSRPEFREDYRGITAIGTQDVQTFTITGDIDALAAAPAIIAYADTSIGAPLGLITMIKKLPATFAASGEQDIDKIPRKGKIVAQHFGKADVNNVVIERDDSKLIDAPKTLLEQIQKNAERPRVPQTASFTHVDYILDGLPGNALEVIEYADGSLVEDLRAKLDLGTSGQVNHIVEYLISGASL